MHTSKKAVGGFHQIPNPAAFFDSFQKEQYSDKNICERSHYEQGYQDRRYDVPPL